jgi:predicted transcriptional regulator
MTQTLVEMATGFVMARMHAGPCPTDVLDQILHATHATLLALSRQEATQKMKKRQETGLPEGLVSLRERPLATLQRSQVICLECGTAHDLLSSRHLHLHGLTAKGYKKKWGIPLTRSLSALSLTQRRRRNARKRDAGQYLAAWRARQRQQVG